QRKLVCTSIGLFNLSNTKQRDCKGTRMSIRGNKGEKRFRKGDFSCPCSVTGGRGGKIELAGDICYDAFCWGEMELSTEKIVLCWFCVAIVEGSCVHEV